MAHRLLKLYQELKGDRLSRLQNLLPSEREEMSPLEAIKKLVHFEQLFVSMLEEVRWLGFEAEFSPPAQSRRGRRKQIPWPQHGLLRPDAPSKPPQRRE